MPVCVEDFGEYYLILFSKYVFSAYFISEDVCLLKFIF